MQSEEVCERIRDMKYNVISNSKMADKARFKNEYFREMLTDTDWVLCLYSACEYLGLSNANFSDNIYVVSKLYCDEHNIEYEERFGILTTTLSQTINDILSDSSIDEQVILESLAEVYFGNKSIDIHESNRKAYERFIEMAKEYYDC